MRPAALPQARPDLHPTAKTAASIANPGTKPEELAQQLVEIISRPDRPAHPRLAMAYAYGRLALSILGRSDLNFVAGEAQIRKLEHAVRRGLIRVDHPDSLLSTAKRALGGDADAFDYLRTWLHDRPHIRGRLAPLRVREPS